MQAENLQAQLERVRDMQRWLLDIGHGVAAYQSEDALDHVVSGIAHALGTDIVRLLVHVEGIRRVFSSKASEVLADVDAALLNALETQEDSGAVEWVRGHDPAPLADLAGLVPESVGSLCAVQLKRADGQPLGLVWAAFGEARPLDEAEWGFLQVAAVQAEIAAARVEAAVQARRQGELLPAVMAGVSDPVLVVDSDLVVRMINPAAREAFEAAYGDISGQPLSIIDGLAELFAGKGESEPAEQARGRKMEISAENGRTYEPTITPLPGEGGAAVGWVIVLRDITALKRLNDNMSEFVSRVSHDLRSPLTFMKGYLDMLGMVGPLNEKQAGFVEKITSGVGQMSDMVEKVIEAARIDPVTGRYTLSREQCDMVELVEKVMAALAEPAARNRLRMTYSIDPSVPVMNLDRGMISSAFTNLVENAIKYTPEGGTVEVSLAVDRQRNDLVFQVKDNGLGISEADQRKLFQRHVRVQRQEWVRIKGSGLGLFIVKNVAQRHGGDAWVVSAPGQGSTFFLSIPMEGSNMVAGEAVAHD